MQVSQARGGLHRAQYRSVNVSSTSAILTSPPAPLLQGEGSKNPPYSLLSFAF
ncbi:hypothetical protein NSTC731_05735 [Nostoc sp. DSM 114167]